MRSIRLSLMVYFLGLLTVALGVASLLVYRSAQQILRDKEKATADLIQAKYDESCRKERKRLDDALLDQASVLAGRLKIQVDWGRSPSRNRTLHSFGAITSAFLPSGHLWAAPWLLQMHVFQRRDPPPPFAFEI